jgi:hypothetical protein
VDSTTEWHDKGECRRNSLIEYRKLLGGSNSQGWGGTLPRRVCSCPGWKLWSRDCGSHGMQGRSRSSCGPHAAEVTIGDGLCIGRQEHCWWRNGNLWLDHPGGESSAKRLHQGRVCAWASWFK